MDLPQTQARGMATATVTNVGCPAKFPKGTFAPKTVKSIKIDHLPKVTGQVHGNTKEKEVFDHDKAREHSIVHSQQEK